MRWGGNGDQMGWEWRSDEVKMEMSWGGNGDEMGWEWR